MVNPVGFSMGRRPVPGDRRKEAMTKKDLEMLSEILKDVEILEENARNIIDQCALMSAALAPLLSVEKSVVPTRKECKSA